MVVYTTRGYLSRVRVSETRVRVVSGIRFSGRVFGYSGTRASPIRYASRFPIQNGILTYPVDFHLAMPQKRGKNVVKYDLNLMIEGTTTRCGVSTYVHLSPILSPRIH